MMKLNKSYLIEHKDEISNTIYCKCLADCLFQNPISLDITRCYKSLIYKFTKNKELVHEKCVIDIDHNYIYEEYTTQLTDEEFKNFEVIGNLFDLINYLENVEWRDE